VRSTKRRRCWSLTIPESVSAAATERTMKLQEVLLKAMAKKISWMSAAEIAGITDRTMRRIRERYQKFGYTGLFDQRKGKRSMHRIPMETAEEVLRLYQETYFDLNMRHFHEKLRDEHKIVVSTRGYSRPCRARVWWRSGASGGRTAEGGRGDRCRACCCTSTGANTAG